MATLTQLSAALDKLPDRVPIELQKAYAQELTIEPRDNSLIPQKIGVTATLFLLDVKKMKDIALCESNMRQYTKEGTLLRGYVHAYDVGVFQINEKVHGEEAKRLGIDLYTTDGNLEFAAILMKREGTRPWNASKKCWNKEIAGWK